MLEDIGKRAKAASRVLAGLDQLKKISALNKAAEMLISETETIIAANKIDITNAKNNNMSEAMLDRLKLTADRVKAMADGLLEVAILDDPIGEVVSMKKRPNGLVIGKQRVPIGVVGMIYESRPNVTVDAFGLCFKSGNAVILRGGSDCINSNIELVRILKIALADQQITEDAVCLIEDTNRELVNELMRMNSYVDVLIPRGGAGLIKNVVENSTVPVIETGTGNCHIYVDKSADIDMAVKIIENAKLQRLGVCNACESLVIHKDIANEAVPRIVDMLKSNACEIRGDEEIAAMSSYIIKANEEDYSTEFLAKIISAKIVNSIDEAIEHINKYSTGHSESIITSDYEASQQFLNQIDSACVYVNASTRFTDGNEFGYGAEIGISTQKLHVRGPVGLEALTSTKYIIYGNGQIR